MGRKVFTISYDDGSKSDLKLIELMKKYGIRGTFNLNSGSYGIDGQPFWYNRLPFECLKDTYSNDFCEVAAHGYVHPDYTKLDYDAANEDITRDVKKLEEIFGIRPIGFAYPFGAVDDKTVEILRKSGIKYSRTVWSTERFAIPEDWLYLNPTCHHINPKLLTLAKEFVDYKGDDDIMFYVWGHAHEFDENNNWEILEQLFQCVAGKSDILYLTNGQAYELLTGGREV